MNISLPPAMKAWVDQQVKTRGFGTSSEFVRHVLREAWEDANASGFERYLLEGLEGPMTPLTKAEVDEMKRGIRKAATQKKRKSA